MTNEQLNKELAANPEAQKAMKMFATLKEQAGMKMSNWDFAWFMYDNAPTAEIKEQVKAEISKILRVVSDTCLKGLYKEHGAAA